MHKKPNPLWFYGGGLVGFGLAVFVLLQLTRRDSAPSSTNQDIRARADKKAGIQLKAKIVSVDSTSGAIVVEEMKMAQTGVELPGTWTGTVIPEVNLSGVRPNDEVVLEVDPPTFLIEKRTFSIINIY